MSDTPWLTIIGLGEDGPEGLPAASVSALKAAQIVMGPPRHLGLLPDLTATQIPWPVPFADGIPLLLSHRGTPTVVLASGDPFWFGAGSVITKHLSPTEWSALPGPSCFSLAAARLGWALEKTGCHALHAAPFSRLRPELAPGRKLIVTLRDGVSVITFCEWLSEQGFEDSVITVLEALGGPRETVSTFKASDVNAPYQHPVCVGLEVAGSGDVITKSSGRADDLFDHDGQITKRPIRALTLSALAPRFGQHLWDIGGGSGSISIEWLLSDPSLTATAIEPNPDRAERIAANALRLGVDRLQVVHGSAPDALIDLPKPDTVFVGGGLSKPLVNRLLALASGTRLVINAVTLESEAVLTALHAARGGELMRIEMSSAHAIGPKRGWKAAYPITQWSHTL